MPLIAWIVLFFVFAVILGFWMGWFVRNSLVKRLKDALGVALSHSTLSFTSKPMKDILGERTVRRWENKAADEITRRNFDELLKRKREGTEDDG